MSKTWVCVILALAGGLLFALGAMEIADQSLHNWAFDELLGLIFLALAMAIGWAPG